MQCQLASALGTAVLEVEVKITPIRVPLGLTVHLKQLKAEGIITRRDFRCQGAMVAKGGD